MLRAFTLTLSLLCLSLFGEAQLHFLPLPTQADSITISLLTCAPGSDVYELEGHTALRIRYADTDIVANWGVFDFDSPNFVYRFCKGETDYCVAACATPLFLNQYARHQRRVIEQALALSHSQASQVIALVDRNLLPANRVYRYNYVLDNCATRPLAIIEQAIGKPVEFHDSAAIEATTFRSEMRRFHASYPWYQFGIDLALGSRIDSVITQRATAFAPVTLMNLMANATILTSSGSIPLVRTTTILVPGVPDGVALPPTPWYLTPLCVCWLIFGITLVVTIIGYRRRRPLRGFDAAFFATEGIVGCAVAFLVFISEHYATTPNWVLAWLNPLALLVPAVIFSRIGRRILIPYFLLNLLLCSIALFVEVVGIQSLSAAFLPLILASALRSAHFLLRTRRDPKI